MPRPRGAKAGKDGYVRQTVGEKGSGRREGQHKTVLREKLGDEPPVCYWQFRGCPVQLDWSATWPQRNAVIPDHLNQVKDDNRPENLVPSCGRCNSKRTAN